MSDGWLELDGVAETSLPSWANDGRSGDRVSFLEAGLLAVQDGLATFARWSDVLSVVKRGDAAFILAPRRPPAAPWIRVGPQQIDGDVDSFLRRLDERRRSGGYRDSVRAQRQNLQLDELRRRVSAREPVPGALEVPSTIVLGRSYPGLGLTQASIVTGGGALGLVFPVIGVVGAGAEELASLCGQLGAIGGVLAGALIARHVGRRWRASKDATLPRQRVLVLAPDGCIIGFRTGVRTLRWSSVGRFESGRIEPDYELGLIVRGADDQKLGEIEAAWLDAPLELVVAVAEAYREAAR